MGDKSHDVYIVSRSFFNANSQKCKLNDVSLSVNITLVGSGVIGSSMK